MDFSINRIAIATGGGDAPGLNAVIRAVVLAADRHGWECHGIRDSFNGLLAPHTCLGEPVVRLSPDSVHGIGHLGGTILGSTNRGNPLRYPAAGGQEADRSDELLGLIGRHGFDALVMVGGDSSMEIAECLARKGLRVGRRAQDHRQ